MVLRRPSMLPTQIQATAPREISKHAQQNARGGSTAEATKIVRANSDTLVGGSGVFLTLVEARCIGIDEGKMLVKRL